jgi:hypothetical protein
MMQIDLAVRNNTETVVKREAFKAIKKICFDHNGTIFGGFVRDEFIAEYYNEKYMKDIKISEDEKKKKFWDINHSPSTRYRTLNPKDIDVSFKTESEADLFIEKLKTVSDFDHVSICTMRLNEYYEKMSNIKSVKTVIIHIKIDQIPFVNSGRIISLSIDIIIPDTENIEPPFNNLDFLCNGFVMTKDNEKRFSKNTGTIIDQYTDYERIMVVSQILRDMRDFKTAICMSNIYSKKRRWINVIALDRITKMMNKKTPWTFINMPFKTEIYEETEEKTECCICSCSLDHNQKVAYTVSQKKDGTEIPAMKLHYKCMMKYLHHQKEDIVNSETFGNSRYAYTSYKCPCRNEITFTRCKIDIQFLYKIDM